MGIKHQQSEGPKAHQVNQHLKDAFALLFQMVSLREIIFEPLPPRSLMVPG
jgi:hypothetical protein